MNATGVYFTEVDDHGLAQELLRSEIGDHTFRRTLPGSLRQQPGGSIASTH